MVSKWLPVDLEAVEERLTEGLVAVADALGVVRDVQRQMPHAREVEPD